MDRSLLDMTAQSAETSAIAVKFVNPFEDENVDDHSIAKQEDGLKSWMNFVLLPEGHSNDPEATLDEAKLANSIGTLLPFVSSYQFVLNEIPL